MVLQVDRGAQLQVGRVLISSVRTTDYAAATKAFAGHLIQHIAELVFVNVVLSVSCSGAFQGL